jgi:hypothetical protein
MKNLIRNILKEEYNPKKMFHNMIKNEGLLMVCRKVGGIYNLAKILDTTPVVLIRQEFVGKSISTRNLELPLQVGGYDFVFEINKIVHDMRDDYLDIMFEIIEGKVELIMTTNETYDLLGEELFENEPLYYEIKHEVQDVVNEYLRLYLKEIKYHLFNGLTADVTNM